MANPRKFSEKIALQKQKQAEGTAEFEKIMKEVYATRRDEPLSASQQRISDCCLGPEQVGGGIPIPGSGGGGGGNSGNAGAGGGGGGGGNNGNNGSGSPTAYRESRGRSVGVGPMRRPSDRKVDRSPYSSNVAYLSPPIDTNWRRSNSDSAIHQSLNMQPENPLYGGQQQQHYMQQQQQQQHAYHPHQRSHSPAASVGLSPTAQRRKAQHMVTQSHSSSNLQQLAIQDQMNHHKLNHNHHLHMHPHQQGSMTKSQLQFNQCGPTNSVYKTLQEQAMAMANTGSLPDLTSVHFSNAPSPSPAAITHNIRTEREQSQSPFNSQSYQQQQQQQQQQQLQQQHSPGGGGGGGLGAGQTHLSFTNLPVMGNPTSNNISANCSTLHSSYGHLPSIGGVSANASSTGNLTEYRNPQHNPPSPAGSASPGLMVSTSPHGHSHDLHVSAPNSPIRHHQQQQQQQQYSDKNIQTYDRFSPSGDYSNSSNNLNPSFHNHFEQFSLVDSSAQSEPQYIPTSLQQQDHHSPHNSYSQSLQFEDVLFGNHQQFSTENGNGGAGRRNDMGSLASKLTGVSGSVTVSSGGDPYMSMSNRNTLNNCSSSLGLSGNSSSSGGASRGTNNNNSSSGSTTTVGTASASCSPLHSPHSPNPHNHSNNNSNLVNDIAAIAQQHQQQQQQQHQKSHHTNDGGGGGGSNNSSNMHNSTPTPTTPNIPSIVFSDFSSVNSDFSKEIFDTLDLDLGQMDVAGLQMLSDPSTIMIADPNIEDSFRRDLN